MMAARLSMGEVVWVERWDSAALIEEDLDTGYLLSSWEQRGYLSDRELSES
jgi:hypothetical protein